MEAKTTPVVPLGELARRVGGDLVGDGERAIGAVQPFDRAGPQDITFIDPKNAAMLAALPGCRAGAVIAPRGLDLPAGLNAIRIDPPQLGLARALAILHPRLRPAVGVSPAAHVGAGVKIGAGANVYPGAYLGDGASVGRDTDILPGVYVGPGARIGASCIIHPNVTIYDGCTLGDRVVVHGGAVIGGDGFGYVPEPQAGDPREPFRHLKIPQVGGVVIEDDVEIGANTTIDRATMAATVIRRGTKIDNLVMIAHNCAVGRHGLVIAQVGISGSTVVGDYVTLAGQAGLVGHIHVGDRAVVAAQAGVTKDVREGQVVIGAPAIDIREGRLAYGLIGRLPELKKALTDLQKRVERLEAAAGGGRPPAR